VNTGVIVTALLAFLGYVVTYMNHLRLAQRKERLERVNRQLSELYGPLVGMSRATETAWVAFRKQYRPDVLAYFDPRNPPQRMRSTCIVFGKPRSSSQSTCECTS
jgi:hypothetical protein